MAKNAAYGTQFRMGTAQVETATVVGTIAGAGNATVITTAAGMTGSPITTSVAVLFNDTADTVAGKIRTALAAEANITARFAVGGVGAQVVLTRLVAAANDATLNININNGTCTGLTAAATSANTTAGVDYSTVAYVTSITPGSFEADTEDVTTHDSTGAWEEVVVTLLRTGEVTLEVVFDPADDTHDFTAGMGLRLKNKTIGFYKVVFPGAVEWTFSAFVTGFESDAPVDGALTAAITLKITGAPTLA